MVVMGRRIPDDNPSLIHHIIYLSFAAAGVAASLAIITALCSNLFRKKESPPPTLETAKESDDSNSKAITASPDMSEVAKLVDKSTHIDSSTMPVTELPLPPALQQPKDANLPNFKRATSERKATMSMSKIKLPKSMSVRNKDHKDDGRRKGKFKPEDSVWMKTIILGEKCVPDEEQDAVIYEGKGKKISAYHPKSCMSISRQCSSIDPEALPDAQSREGKIT